MTTQPNIDFSLLTPASNIVGEDKEETDLLIQLYREAKNFLLEFEWCREITCAFLGYGIGEVVGIFYFEIVPSQIDVDKSLWVIVGDLPPAYLVTDEINTPAKALKVYIELFREWVEAVKSGVSVQGLIPANVPPSLENAASLKSRLAFLENEILPQM